MHVSKGKNGRLQLAAATNLGLHSLDNVCRLLKECALHRSSHSAAVEPVPLTLITWGGGGWTSSTLSTQFCILTA